MFGCFRKAKSGVGYQAFDGCKVFAKEALFALNAFAHLVALGFHHIRFLRLQIFLRIAQSLGQRAARGDNVGRELDQADCALGQRSCQLVNRPLAECAEFIGLGVSRSPHVDRVVCPFDQVSKRRGLRFGHSGRSFFNGLVFSGQDATAQKISFCCGLSADWSCAIRQPTVDFGLSGKSATLQNAGAGLGWCGHIHDGRAKVATHGVARCGN